jgi:hypothetical protein
MGEQAGQFGSEQVAAWRARAELLRAVEEEGYVTPHGDTAVHNALDLARGAGADPMLLRRLEAISCAIAWMRYLRAQGRVNAYASQLLRLRAAARAL